MHALPFVFDILWDVFIPVYVTSLELYRRSFLVHVNEQLDCMRAVVFCTVKFDLRVSNLAFRIEKEMVLSELSRRMYEKCDESVIVCVV